VSAQRSSLAQRAFRLAGSRSAYSSARPAGRRIAIAGLTAAASSLAADLALATVGRAAFAVPSSFGKFAFDTYAPLIVIGTAAATFTWALVTRLARQPKWLLTRLVALVTAVLLIPDFLLFGTPGNPAGPVVVLMLMHLAFAAITYTALIETASARRQRQSTGPRLPRSD
jgi:hypothetical protein